MKRLPRTLDANEVRVLGALLEKEQATPDYYPMTVNSLTNACNQKTNRDPVMSLTDEEVQTALDRLFNEDVFAWRSRSGRTTKWKHNVDRRWGLMPASKAVMTLLLLRGGQTVGELRSRGERLFAFENLDAVERALRNLAEGEEPLVAELGRQPGQKESRWTHLVSGPVAAQSQTHASQVGRPVDGELASLEARVARLERLVADWTDPPTQESS